MILPRYLALCLLLSATPATAATVLKVETGDIHLGIGQRDGVQIGTVFNVYRKQEIEGEFGSLKITTRAFIGRIYAYKISEGKTLARIREMPVVSESGAPATIARNDIAEPVFVLSSDDLFKPGDSELNISQTASLDQLVRFIQRFKTLKARIEVHTDNTVEHAVRLSRQQAQNLRAYLARERQISENLLVPAGYGAQKPIALNGSAEGRRANRRIEVVIER